MVKQIDLLVLEDTEIYFEVMEMDFPEGMTYEVVVNSREFKDWLKEGNQAKIYLLDNEVPPFIHSQPKAAFIDNCDRLIETYPKARVYFTSRDPKQDVVSYCEQKDIKIVRIGEIVDIYKARVLMNSFS